MEKITKHEIYEAYRKLKNYYYYDNTSLTIRYKIAEFERKFYDEPRSDFEQRFEAAMDGVYKIVNGEDKDDRLLNSLLSEIRFTYITKSVEKSDEKNQNKQLIVNKPLDDNIVVSKLNMLIDAPIEIHVISVLWLMYVGKHFGKLMEAHNYAYQFSYDEEADDLHHGLQLFRPYYIGYQKWRDTAIKMASWLLDEGKDATILCLDIQRYYYSVRLNVRKILESVNQKMEKKVDLKNATITRLNNLIQLINQSYTRTTWDFTEEELRISEEEFNSDLTVLPVGLLSSAVLANLYLCDFDDRIVRDLNPVYYGRYVDDMLFVFTDRRIEDKNVIQNFMKSFFDKGILKEAQGMENNANYEFCDPYRKLMVQKEKVVLQHFYHGESRAAINLFTQNIERQRSEFRFLPDEDFIDNEFDSDAFTLQYSDSIQKLRSLQGYKEDRFGASKFLASKIFMASVEKGKGGTKDSKERSSQQILTFFKGGTGIDFCTLWEKVATYFFITEDRESLRKFIEQTMQAIDRVTGKNISDDWINRYKEDLKQLLKLAVATPYALNLKFELRGFPKKEADECKEIAKAIRHANMFRHGQLGIKGINYTKTLLDDDVNLFDVKSTLGELENTVLPYLAPRYIRYDEANLLAILMRFRNEPYGNSADIQQWIANKTADIYNTLNRQWYVLFDNPKAATESIPVRTQGNNDGVWYVEITENAWKGKIDKRIAIANLKVSEKQVTDSMLKRPELTANRRNTLFSIINQAVKEKCKILVLPELSVPYQWLDLLVSQSKRHNIAIIAGLEYFYGKENYVYNCVATILPFNMKFGTTAAVNLRVKNYYSPLEKKLLEGYRYKVPQCQRRADALYCLFHWRKVYFSVYNCFELANIRDRSFFKSKVDFIVATELNKDVNYFADIAGSWVRDIHCFFIQVNTSHYGDSCIVRPSKTETSRMVSVKGGKNSIVLTEDLEIESLRTFQFKEHITQMDDHSYKVTPPDFPREYVEMRIEDKSIVKTCDTCQDNN